MLLSAPTIKSTRYAHAASGRQDALLRLLWAYPLMWGIGLGGAFWALAALIALPKLVRNPLSTPAKSCLAVALFIASSSVVGISTFGFDLARVVSMIGNVGVWIALAGLLTSNISRKVSLARAIAWIASAQGVLVTTSMLIYPHVLPIPILGSYLTGAPTGFAAFATNELYYPSWFGGIAYRSSGIMGNPTWAGAFAVLGGVAAIYLLRRHVSRLLGAVALCSGVICLWLSLSRATVGAVALAALIAWILHLRRQRSSVYPLAVVGLLALAFLSIVFWSGQIGNALNDVNDERGGSLVTRSEIYAATWHYVEELRVPIIGYGIKPKEAGLVASVASHSTYLGLLFRAGVCGLVAFIILLGSLLRRAMSRDSIIAATLVLFIGIWCALEDIDGGHLLPIGLVFASHLSRESTEIEEGGDCENTYGLPVLSP